MKELSKSIFCILGVAAVIAIVAVIIIFQYIVIYHFICIFVFRQRLCYWLYLRLLFYF